MRAGSGRRWTPAPARESSEWEAEFRNRQSRLANDLTGMSGKRSQLLGAAVQEAMGSIRLLHGTCKEPRKLWTALAELAASAGGKPPERDLFGAEDTLLSAPLRNSLDALHELFGQAPELGSLIDLHALKADLFRSDFESVRALFVAALERERMTDEQMEHAVAARGMARAAELLAGRYHLVIANVPYLARGRQGETLRAFCR